MNATSENTVFEATSGHPNFPKEINQPRPHDTCPVGRANGPTNTRGTLGLCPYREKAFQISSIIDGFGMHFGSLLALNWFPKSILKWIHLGTHGSTTSMPRTPRSPKRQPAWSQNLTHCTCSLTFAWSYTHMFVFVFHALSCHKTGNQKMSMPHLQQFMNMLIER